MATSLFPMPNSEAIRQAMEVAALSTEGALHFHSVITTRFGDDPNVIAQSEVFVENVSKKLSARGEPWSGTGRYQYRTDFEQLQRAVSDSAIKTLQTMMSDNMIHMDYAIEDGQFIRGYAINGEPISNELQTALDDAYTAYLAQEGFISEDGVLYEVASDGLIKEEKGRKVKAKTERIQQLMAAFPLDLNKKNIALELQEHPFPGTAQVISEVAGPTVQAGQPEVAADVENKPNEPYKL